MPSADLLIGRVRTTTLNGGGTGLPFLPADPTRVGILFSSGVMSATATLIAKGLGQSDYKVTLVVNTEKEYTWAKHGPLCGAEWQISGGVNGDTAIAYELLYQG